MDNTRQRDPLAIRKDLEERWLANQVSVWAGTDAVAYKKTTKTGTYWIVHNAHHHPLAGRNGRVPRHRLILWHHLGQPATSPCEWCGYSMPWKTSLPEPFLHIVNVDHRNGVPGDDIPRNLVASCWWCNANRPWAERYPEWWDRWRRWLADVPPATRPNLPSIMGEILGIAPQDLIARQEAS